MENTLRYIGNDISKLTFDAAFLKADNTYEVIQFTNNKSGWQTFEELLLDQDICVMEATGAYHVGLATYLYNRGRSVSIVNPLSVKYFSRMKLVRAKTDKADANLIAEFGRSTRPSIWEPQPAHLTELQQLMTINEQFLKQKGALENQLQSFKLTPNVSLKAIKILKQQIQNLKLEIIKIEHQVSHLIEKYYKRIDKSLQSIPGIGPKTAATLILITGGFTKFEKYKALIAYAGLAPRTYQSGTSVKGSSHICKLGSQQLRKLLYVCAHSAKRFNPICKKLFDRLYHEKKKPFKVAMIAVANKLIKLAFTLAISKELFDPLHHLKFQTTK